MDDPAENVAADSTFPRRGLGVGRFELQASMRAGLVVMGDIRFEHRLEMTARHDQRMIPGHPKR